MDDLDLLKKDWKKQEENLPHLTYDEIYKMIWKKSSSIVKWIFIISIVEFLLGAVLNIVLADDEYWEQMKKYKLTEFVIGVYIITYLITFYFIYRFYLNYRRISTTDSASRLMKNILRTRKTVKYYIGFVLISSAVVFIVMLYSMLHNHILTAETTTTNMEFDTRQWLIFIGGTLLVLAIVLGIIWLIYRIVYGILLRRLNKNYKELKKLEME
ncbi:membrane protein [Christiangramia forsetii]|uniref:Membrane protein n=2 Tax=Christiangramia forsetii TaxID=411153 RepID=A0M040_CHRFK|nr:membrane protein [Christiangramia forsetii]GGG41863.1 hypothetical protein GCM10011532_27070 [Christiangramia forsetii]CAL65985.1 membrane protein [Christiangramia forsetii KT0803]